MRRGLKMIVSKWKIEFAGNRWTIRQALVREPKQADPHEALHRMSLGELLYFALTGEGVGADRA